MTDSHEPLFSRPKRNYDLEMDNLDATRGTPRVKFYDNSDSSLAEIYKDASSHFWIRTSGGNLSLFAVGGNIVLTPQGSGYVYPGSAGITLGQTGATTRFKTLNLTDNINMWGYADIYEISTPANPGANYGRLYTKDDSGTTKLYFKDSAGAETDLITGAGAGFWTDEGTYLKATEADVRVYSGANYLRLHHDGTEGYLSVNSGSLYIDAPNDIMLDSGDDIVLMTNSVEFMRMNLGTDKVEISKALTIGAYTLPTTDGTNTQTLQTNGSGTVSWGSILTNPMTATLNMGTNSISNVTLLGATSSAATSIISAINTNTSNTTSLGVYGEGYALGIYGKLKGTTSAFGAIYGASTSVTSGKLLVLNHTTSTFTGTMFYANMASGSGAFTGNFVDFRVNNSSKFSIESDGDVNAGEFLAWDSAGNQYLRMRQTTHAFISNTLGDIRIDADDDMWLETGNGALDAMWLEVGDEIYLATNQNGTEKTFDFDQLGDLSANNGDMNAEAFNVTSPKDFEGNAIETIKKGLFNSKKTFSSNIKKLPVESVIQKKFSKRLKKHRKKMEDKEINKEEIDSIIQEEEKGRDKYVKEGMKQIRLSLGEMIAVLWKGMKEMDTRMSVLESN